MDEEAGMSDDTEGLIRWIVLLLFILAIALIGTHYIRADIAEVKAVCTQMGATK